MGKILQYNAQREILTDLFGVVKSIIRVIMSGKFILGGELNKLETNISNYISGGDGYVVGVNSCTDALHLSFLLYGIGKGDEVIVQSNTAIPTVNSIVMCGATPVFVDVDENYQMDINDVKNKITNKTRAIVCVHLYGNSCDIVKLSEICGESNIKLIEDCAQSFGGEYNGKKLGTFGDIACFSFYPTKVLGGYGDSGAILCNSEVERDLLKTMRFHGISEGHYAETNAYITKNSRLDEIQAAILNVKFKSLNRSILKRRDIANYYLKFIKNERFILPNHNEGSVWYNFVVRCNNRDDVVEYLKNNNVYVGINYPTPIHLMNGYNNVSNRVSELPNTVKFAGEVFNLPMYPTLKKREIKYIVKLLNNYDT